MRASPLPLLSSRTTIRTLHVDDDEMFGRVTAELLEAAETRLSVVTATSADAGLDRLAAGDIDCVVSDYDMPGENGIEFLERVREHHPHLPFILFTGKGSEGIASDAVSAGVTDYLQKEPGVDQYTVLANRIVNATEKYWTETDLERRIVQQKALATLGRDALEAEELTPLFDEAVQLVVDCLGSSYAKVLEWQPERDAFALRSGVGWHDDAVERGDVLSGTASQAGYTLASAEPVVVVDLEEEPRFSGPDLLVDHGVVSGISVVIGATENPWGVLGTHTTDRREFTDQDVTFVQSVANVLAAAIDRQCTEAQLRESETRFREIAELSPDGIFRTDVNGTFTYVSPASEVLLGQPADDLVGTQFERVVASKSHEAAVEGLRRVIDGEVVRGLGLTLVDEEGTEFDVEVSASPVRHGGQVEFVQGFARDVTEKNEREQELQESRERFQALVDHFPNGGVFLFDEDLRFTVAGGDELEEVGLNGDVMVGRTLSNTFPPENAAVLEPHYRAALTGEKHSFEDGWQNNYYQIQTIPLRNADGEVISGMAVAQNITERVERERELQESRERYQTLVENFPGGVVLFDHDLRIIAAGGTEFERATWDPNEGEGELLRDNLTPEGTAYLDTHYRATLDGERRTFEYEASGTHYRLETIPLFDTDGQVAAGMAVTQNVTERVERDRKLAQLRECSQELMYTETIEETVQVAVDAARDVLDASLSGFLELNAAGDRLEPGVLAETAADVFQAPSEYDRDAEPGTRDAIVWGAFERGEPLHVPDTEAYDPLTEPARSRSVIIHPIEQHGVFLVTAQEPNAFDETDRTLIDILAASLTAGLDRVEREQRLRAREQRLEDQNERLSRFASIVSHDLRSPLSVAQGWLEFARTSNEDAHFEAVERAHNRMSRLIDGLLQLTIEGDVGEVDSVDLASAARASWTNVETTGASLVVDSTQAVAADENRLRQLFENLFRNAVEHGSTGSQNARRSDDSVEHGSTSSRPQADDSVEHGGTAPDTDDDTDTEPLSVIVGDLPDGFYVEDDGVGIKPDRRETVFEMGHSTSAEGTGLGLGIVADVATEHGWTVEATSGRDGGARFEFTGVEVADEAEDVSEAE